MTDNTLEIKLLHAWTNGTSSREGANGLDRNQSGAENGLQGLNSDEALSEWAPRAPLLAAIPPSHAAESYLPGSPAASVASSTSYRATSKPFNLPLTPNQQSMSYSLARLLSKPRFESFLSTPLGYAQFHAYLAGAAPDLVVRLEMWRDLDILHRLELQTGFATKGVLRVYHDELDKLQPSIANDASRALGSPGSIVGRSPTANSLEGPTKRLLDSFYANEFEAFMKSRLVKHTQEQLGRYHLATTDARSGIGEAYVLVNPRLQDRPIVLVSPGFEQLTGYRADQIIGRNCRFLQGKGTAPAAVKAIKDAVDSGTDICQLVLNYTSDARPFMNLLTMIALHDTHGRLTYFIGGQSDLTEAMTTVKGPVSLLQAHEDVFAAEFNQLSERVAIEAQEAALAQTDPGAVEVASPDTTLMDKQEGVHRVSKGEKIKNLYHKLVGKARRPGSPAQEPHGPLVPPRSVFTAHKVIDGIASEYSSTYDKLLVVRQHNREILFATSGFLRQVAIPGTTRQEICASPLVFLDLLDLVIAPGHSKDSAATRDLHARIKTTFERGEQASFACALSLKSVRPDFATIPVVVGRIYVSPLKDSFGGAVAFSVVGSLFQKASDHEYTTAPSIARLDNFAPLAPPHQLLPPSNAESYLPSAPQWNDLGSYHPTSRAMNLELSPLQESLNYSLGRLLSLPRFAAFVSTPVGFHQFESYLAMVNPNDAVQLNLWRDLDVVHRLKLQIAFASKSVAGQYEEELANVPRPLAKSVARELRAAVEAAITPTHGLGLASTSLLESLYANQFESFIKSRLSHHTNEQLSRHKLTTEDRSGIGEAYVLVNPRLVDRPVVLCSPAFEKLTGYKASQIVGRNCRFLQGPSSSPQAIKRIKHAVDTEQEITQIILNYTATAQPFMNLLTLLPLHDTNGKIMYFIGGQIDCTAELVNDKSLTLVHTEESLTNVDVGQLTHHVAVETRETAIDFARGGVLELPPTRYLSLTPPPEKLNNSIELEKQAPNGIEKKASRDRWPRPCPRSLVARTPPLIQDFVARKTRHTVSDAIELVIDTRASVYQKLLIVKTQTREIVHTTSGFLRFVGLAATSREDIDRSVLRGVDVVELLYDAVDPRDEVATRRVRERVKHAIARGLGTSLACAIGYAGPRTSSDAEPANVPIAGRLHVSPLRDGIGECSASCIVFA
ncbi:hypothetical protein JCM11491_002169 [Sporobolomyces phaffii]